MGCLESDTFDLPLFLSPASTHPPPVLPIRCSQRARETSARVGCSLDQLRESARSQSWTRSSLTPRHPTRQLLSLAPLCTGCPGLVSRSRSWSVREGGLQTGLRPSGVCPLHRPTQPMLCCFQKPVRVGFQRPLPKASASLGAAPLCSKLCLGFALH